MKDKKWVEELFIKKGHLFLKVLDTMWQRAHTEVEGIIKLFDKYGVGKDSSILEIGCGNGRIVVNLALKGYKKLYGIDISPVLINDAKNKMREFGVSNIELFVGDVRDIDNIIRDNKFDVILCVWTSLIGYYDETTDKELFKKLYKISSKDAYLFILNTANRDYIIQLRSLGCRGPFYEEYDDIVIVEKTEYDVNTSRTHTKWVYYKKDGNNLIYIDEIEMSLRLYSIHELIKMAEGAGWKYVDAYRNLVSLEAFRPTLSSINLVLRK